MPGRPYLGVAHAGRGDQGLLDGVALLEDALLLPGHAPVTLDQELHHLQVAAQRGVNQSALPVFVQVIHLGKTRYNRPNHTFGSSVSSPGFKIMPRVQNEHFFW